MKILLLGARSDRPSADRGIARQGTCSVALTRSPEKAQALAKQGIEPAIADVFDSDAVQAAVGRAQPDIVIEQLTALPRTYTRESLTAAADFNTRIRVEGGANRLAAAQAAVCGAT